MGTVRRLAMEVGLGLKAALPKLRKKTVVSKVALAVGAMIEGQTPNTTELANLLPLDTDRQDMREQWLRRLLKNPLLSSMEVLEPWARQALAAAGQNGQTIILSMDQTDVGDRFALLMVSLGVGDRALPLAWTVETGPANLGFNAQRVLLERVRTWLPAGAEVLLSADRFYPSVALFEWLSIPHISNWLIGYGDQTPIAYPQRGRVPAASRSTGPGGREGRRTCGPSGRRGGQSNRAWRAAVAG